MKILVMGFSKVKYMPYMNFYLNAIEKRNHEIHVLYWNRDLQEEDLSAYPNCTFHEFRCYQEDDVSKISKLKSFFKYRSFAKKILNSQHYDLLIVLHSLTGVVTRGLIIPRYTDKIIFDYRDSTYEKFGYFKNRVADLVAASCATFVSSDAFRKFLPQNLSYKIFTSHNIIKDSLNHGDDRQKYGISSDKIRIAFWGFIRHEKLNCEIIRKLSRDHRFELHYYGREQQVALNLKKYVEDHRITNVFFHGEYQPCERYNFIRSTDIINNIYHDSNMMLAMGNKYYDGAIFKIPQICMKGSFMGQAAAAAGIGLECDPYEDDFADLIYDFYIKLDKYSFYENCRIETERVFREFLAGNIIIRQMIERSDNNVSPLSSSITCTTH